jgi:hypothetical protein
LRSNRTNLIKIGRTSYFRSRYSDLCAEHSENLEILGVVSEERFAERQLHKHFAKFRVVKEWFADDRAIRKFIADHATLEFEAHDSPRNEVLVPIDRVVAYRAKKNAARRNVQLSGYLSELLRKAVDDEFKGG